MITDKLKERFEAIANNLVPAFMIPVMVEAMSKAYQMDREAWISVETPPTEDKQYNVCYKMPCGNWHVFTTGYSLNFKRFDVGNANITHYSSLPTPPQG